MLASALVYVYLPLLLTPLPIPMLNASLCAAHLPNPLLSPRDRKAQNLDAEITWDMQQRCVQALYYISNVRLDMGGYRLCCCMYQLSTA